MAKQLAAGRTGVEDGQETALSIERPTQTSGLLTLPADVLAIVLRFELGDIVRVKALFDRKDELMQVCLAFVDAGRLLSLGEAQVTSTVTLEALHEAVEAVSPGDGEPMSVRMRIRKLSIALESPGETFVRHEHMISVIVERCVGLRVLRLDHLEGHRSTGNGERVGAEVVAARQYIIEVLRKHEALESIDLPDECGLYLDEILTCVHEAAALRLVDTRRMSMAFADDEGPSGPAAGWRVEFCDKSRPTKLRSIQVADVCRSLGSKLRALHVRRPVSLAWLSPLDLVHFCPNLRVIDLALCGDRDEAQSLVGASAALQRLRLDEVRLAFGEDNCADLAVVRAIAGTSARIMELSGFSRSHGITLSLGGLIGMLRALAILCPFQGDRTLILRNVRSGKPGSDGEFTTAKKVKCMSNAYAVGFDLYLDGFLDE